MRLTLQVTFGARERRFGFETLQVTRASRPAGPVAPCGPGGPAATGGAGARRAGGTLRALGSAGPLRTRRPLRSLRKRAAGAGELDRQRSLWARVVDAQRRGAGALRAGREADRDRARAIALDAVVALVAGDEVVVPVAAHANGERKRGVAAVADGERRWRAERGHRLRPEAVARVVERQRRRRGVEEHRGAAGPTGVEVRGGQVGPPVGVEVGGRQPVGTARGRTTWCGPRSSAWRHRPASC